MKIYISLDATYSLSFGWKIMIPKAILLHTVYFSRKRLRILLYWISVSEL